MTGAQLNVADPSPGASVRFVGAVNVATHPLPLTPVISVLTGAEHGPTVPSLPVSNTVHVTVWLRTFSRPETRIGLDVPVTGASAPLADDEHVTVNDAPGSPSPVKLTLTDPTSATVTETFVGALGVVADAEVADMVSMVAANRITLAERATILLSRFIVLLEAAAICPQRGGQ